MSGDTPERSSRRWLRSCALVLPLLAILWLAAVVAVLPAAPQIERPRLEEAPELTLFETETAFWIHNIGGARERRAAGLEGSKGFDAASLEVWERMAAGDPASSAVAPLEIWEREHDARVWVWEVEAVEVPPLVAHGIGQPSSVEARTAESEPSGGLAAAWTRVTTQDGMDLAFDPGMFQN